MFVLQFFSAQALGAIRNRNNAETVVAAGTQATQAGQKADRIASTAAVSGSAPGAIDDSGTSPDKLRQQVAAVQGQVSALQPKRQAAIARIQFHGANESNLRLELASLTLLAAGSRMRINQLDFEVKGKLGSKGANTPPNQAKEIDTYVGILQGQIKEEQDNLQRYLNDIKEKDPRLFEELSALTKAQADESAIKDQEDQLKQLMDQIKREIPEAERRAREIKAAKERQRQQPGAFEPGGPNGPGGAGGAPQFPAGGGPGSGYIQQAKALLRAILILMISGVGNNNPFFNIAKLLAGKSMVEIAKTLTEAGMTDEVVNKTPMLRHEALLVDTQASGLRGIFETAIQYWNQAAQANKQIAKDAQQLAQRA